MSIITRDYQGHAIAYQDDGWFNATQAATKFGKAPHDWLRLPGTTEYLNALTAKYGNFSHLKTKRGATGGTWLHPRLAVMFARWLDVDFAVWCDEQISELVSGNTDWRKLRSASASSSKVQSAMLQEVRQQIGKATAAHHHMNEHKLINSLLTGEYKGLDRETLSTYQLDFLAHFELRNAVLIGMGLTYEQRKGALKAEAMTWAQSHDVALLTPSRAIPQSATGTQ